MTTNAALEVPLTPGFLGHLEFVGNAPVPSFVATALFQGQISDSFYLHVGEVLSPCLYWLSLKLLCSSWMFVMALLFILLALISFGLSSFI